LLIIYVALIEFCGPPNQEKAIKIIEKFEIKLLSETISRIFVEFD